MKLTSTNPRIPQMFDLVKSSSTFTGILPSDSMIHHSNYLPYILRGSRNILFDRTSYYGVSSSYRVLSPQLLLKKFDAVRDCLQYTLGLSLGQREVTLRMLRLWAYYGKVYPNEALITSEPGCSKATFWRTIRLLQDMGLIHIINRYLTPYRRQISNLYRLDKLVLLLARYLAEHGQRFCEKWIEPYLLMPGSQFWRQVWQTPGDRAAPGVLAF